MKTQFTEVPHHRPGQRYLYRLFAICFLSGIFGGAISVLPSAYLPDIVMEFTGSTADEATGKIGSWVSFLFMAGWLVGAMALGFLSDRVGRRTVLTIALACCGLGSLAGALAQNWHWLAASRMLTGAGVGTILVVTPVIISETWGERTRAIALGILSVSFPVGIVGSGLITYAVAGWRSALMVGELCLLLAVPAFLLLRESPLWAETKTGSPVFSMKKYRPELLSGIVVYGAMLIGLWAAFSWLPTWVQSLGESAAGAAGQTERGAAVGLLGAGGMVGGVLSGFLANRWGEKKVQAACFIACLVLSYLLFQVTKTYSWHVLAGIALLGINFGASQGVLNTFIPEMFPAAVRSTATGLCFNAGRVFTAAAVFFVGAMVTWFGGYGNAIFVFSLIYIPGLLALLYARTAKFEQK